MKTKILNLICLVLLTGSVMAQNESVIQTPDTLRLTLKETIQLALKNNPDLKRIQLEEEILDRQVAGAKSSILPQVSGKAGYTDNFSLPQQLLPGEIFGQEGQIPVQFGVRYGLNAGIEVSQLLYSQEYFSNIRMLSTTQDIYALQTLSNKEDLVYNVAQLYIQHKITQIQIDIMGENLKRLDNLLRITKSQYENGIVKKLDVEQVLVNHTNLKSELANLEIGAKQQLNYIKYYLALEMSQTIVLDENLETETDQVMTDSLLLSENTNLQLLEKQQLMNEMQKDVIQAGYFPTLSAFLQYNYTGQGNELNFDSGNYSSFTAGLWGINLSVPIFDGFQKNRKVQENKIKQEQLEYQIENFKTLSQMEFDNASMKIRHNNQMVKTQFINMELAQGLYDITQISYQEGVAPLSELLNAESSLNESQSQYLTALINMKLAELDFIKVSGELARLIKSNN